jgi:hypothetical protein
MKNFPESLKRPMKSLAKLRAKGLSVKFDNRDTHKPGWKFAEYELKGCSP